MDRILLYELFFKEKDQGKPYQTLEEYLQDLFHMLDGYIQVAFELQEKRGEDIPSAYSKERPEEEIQKKQFTKAEYLIADILKMEEQIQRRSNESSNRMIQIEREFHISAFERFQLLMALSVKWHPAYESYYSSIQQNGGCSYPTKGLALFLYGLVHEIESGEKGRLLWDNNTLAFFLQYGQGTQRFSDIMVLEEGFTRYILGYEDYYRLKPGIIDIEDPAHESSVLNIHTGVLEKLTNIWGKSRGCRIMCRIYGDKGVGKKHIVKSFSKTISQKVLFCSMNFIDTLSEMEGLEILHKIHGNVLVMDAIPCFIITGRPQDTEQSGVMQTVLAEVEKRFGFSIILTGEDSGVLFTKCRSHISIEVPPLNAGIRLALWKEFSGQVSYEDDVELPALVNKHYADVGDIKDIIQTACHYAASQGKTTVGNRELFLSFQARQRGNLSNLAVRMNAAVGWDDLVIDDRLKEQLFQICNQIIYKDKVIEQWGFMKKMAYGKGVSVLFHGPPGTGKTMAAQVMANELGQELYRIDISQIHSKYIGETEKNISELFLNAKNMNAILFFDEADALFAKRSEVKNSNDRNANSVTAHLLQKLEEYEGISILATNLSGSIDDAFKRRIKFMVPFEYPDVSLRLKLFQVILPPEAQCDECLNLEYFAEHFEMTGSSIKEVLINSAFLAASKGQGIKNEHVAEAIKQNFQKYGKMLTDNDFGYLL